MQLPQFAALMPPSDEGPTPTAEPTEEARAAVPFQTVFAAPGKKATPASAGPETQATPVLSATAAQSQEAGLHFDIAALLAANGAAEGASDAEVPDGPETETLSVDAPAPEDMLPQDGAIAALMPTQIAQIATPASTTAPTSPDGAATDKVVEAPKGRVSDLLTQAGTPGLGLGQAANAGATPPLGTAAQGSALVQDGDAAPQEEAQQAVPKADIAASGAAIAPAPQAKTSATPILPQQADVQQANPQTTDAQQARPVAPEALTLQTSEAQSSQARPPSDPATAQAAAFTARAVQAADKETPGTQPGRTAAEATATPAPQAEKQPAPGLRPAQAAPQTATGMAPQHETQTGADKGAVPDRMTAADRTAPTDHATSKQATATAASDSASALARPEPNLLNAGVDTVAGDFSVTETRAGDRAETAQAQATPATARPETPQNVAAQIAEVVRTSNARAVELRLHPEELGRVSLTMSQDATGGMTVALTVERADTLEMMRRNIDILGQELRQMGYSSVGFSFQGGGTESGGQTASDGFTQGGTSDQGQNDLAELQAQTNAPVSPTRGTSPSDRIDIRL